MFFLAGRVCLLAVGERENFLFLVFLGTRENGHNGFVVDERRKGVKRVFSVFGAGRTERAYKRQVPFQTQGRGKALLSW